MIDRLVGPQLQRLDSPARLFVPLAFALAAIALPHDAAIGHGRFPATVSITVRPGSGEEMIVGTTFGAIISSDGGSTWRWICEEAIGYPNSLDPRFVWSANGTLFVASFFDLLVSTDNGCTWAPHPAFAGRGAAEVAVHPRDADLVFAVSNATSTTSDLPSGLFRSHDGGGSFAPTSLLRPGASFTSVKISPSDPNRIYVGAWHYRLGAAWLYRSDDGGGRWDEIPQILTATSSMEVLGVSTISEDIVFTERARAGTHVVFRSADGGRTQEPVLSVDANIRGFAVSEDGGTILIATTGALYRSADGGTVFSPLEIPGQNACVTFAGGITYACGWPWSDGWALARSADAGAHFERMYTLGDLGGVLECAPDTPTGRICPPFWPALADRLGIMPAIDNPGGRDPVSVAAEGCACASEMSAGGPRTSSSLPLGGLFLLLLLSLPGSQADRALKGRARIDEVRSP